MPPNFVDAEPSASDSPVLLFNGIPRFVSPPTSTFRGREPMLVPYLTERPPVVPIDVGRQLFVDDFLIESTTLKRVFHAVEFYTNNPVLKPDKPWEIEGRGPMAMPFSDGVWYDDHDRLFKMWYMSGYAHSTSYATSKDGLEWEKPSLDVKPETNVVQPDKRDSSTVWLDSREPDARRRYKMFRSHYDGKSWGLSVHFSADGIHWGPPVLRTAPAEDRTTVFYNPIRQVWSYSLKTKWENVRARRYWEVTDLVEGPQWTRADEPVLWIASDRLDPLRDDLNVTPQLYNLDAVGYESLLLGLFTIWRGDNNVPTGRPKPNSIFVGFSRDGFHWDRPWRQPFIPVSERTGDWNWGNVQSAGGCCLIVGSNLYFYVSGRTGSAANRDAGGGTGLAILRRDGFASMETDTTGTLTTRPVKFTGTHLFLNAATAAGELRVEALDEARQIIPPFTLDKSIPMTTDSTSVMARWRGIENISALAGKTVRFRFHLKRGSLYSFWVSQSDNGSSMGFTAAGGPNLNGQFDCGPTKTETTTPLDASRKPTE
ncbi:MAG: glycosyl hydrolase family 32 [Verrucomicrobiae bacterium]|nr:glycosyl hydrolase family 32 [Verrucomicrobiae bacterium]